MINCLSTVTVVKNHETVNRVETLKIMHYPFRLQGGHEQSPNASKTKWKNEAQKETEISKAQHSNVWKTGSSFDWNLFQMSRQTFPSSENSIFSNKHLNSEVRIIAVNNDLDISAILLGLPSAFTMTADLRIGKIDKTVGKVEVNGEMNGVRSIGQNSLVVKSTFCSDTRNTNTLFIHLHPPDPLHGRIELIFPNGVIFPGSLTS